jgi:hypothetical protein
MLLPLSGLFAQAATSQTYQILSFDIGYAPGYDLTAGTGGFVTETYFGFNVRLADPLAIGFATIGGTTGLNLLKVKYDVLPKLRAVVGYGLDTGFGWADFGLEIVPFRNKVSGLSAEFKVVVDSTWLATGSIGDGIIYFGLVVGVGL